MKIHELNEFVGTLGAGDYFATDNGTDTSKVSAEAMLAPLNDRIDNIITSPAPTEQEIIDARGSYNTLGDAITEPVDELRTELVDNNSFDVLAALIDGAVTSFSSSGVTFTRSGNTYTFVGTATRTAFVRYWSSPSSFPSNVKAGGTYYLHYKAKKMRLQIAAYRNNSSSDFDYIYDSTSGGVVNVPSNATGLLIRIVVFTGVTVNETIEIPKLLTAPSNGDLLDITDEIKQLTVEELLNLPDVDYSLNGGITFTCENGVCTFDGTTNTASWHRNLFDDSSNLPEWAERGETYAVQFEPSGTVADDLRLQVAAYKNDSTYIWICDTAENTEFTIPNDPNYVGMNIRFYIANKGATVHATVEPKILSAKTNKMLTDDIGELIHSGAVSLIKDDQYYVRTSYDETHDSVTAFRYPETEYNYTFNLRDARLISKDTALADTVDAYRSAALYKDMHDEFPAFIINNVIVGSNHGNPNFIKCTCSHSLDESAIGTVWSDGTNDYTVVQVYSTYIVVGSLDSNGQLIYREPSTLTRGGTTLSVSPDKIQLRRSAINREIEMLNDAGANAIKGGSGAFIRIVEEYDICDQSKMLSWLAANVGDCTNASYYDNSIPYKLASVRNLFIFNPNSTMTVYGTLTARESITVNNLYGAMSLDFHSEGAGSDYGYVPLSNEFATPAALDYTTTMQITPSVSGVPYRFYQMTSTGAGKGFFLHLIDGLGDCDAETRATLNPFAYFSGNAEKLYLQVRQNVSMASGQSLAWGYGRGMYKKTANQTVNACFRLNDAWIVAMDWHNNFSGYAELPKELAGGKISVIEKTDTVTVGSAFVGNNGIKVNCAGSGYCVLRIE